MPACSSAAAKPGVGRQAGIRVDLEHEEHAAAVDAKVDARVAVEREQLPAGEREPRRARSELGLDAERADGVAILEAVGVPLRGVADDRGLVGRKAFEPDLGDGQARAARPGPR